MELSHVGANRKEVRTTAFADRTPEIVVDLPTGNLVLSIRNADGMGTRGQYDYKVVLTPADLGKILKAVSLDRSAFSNGTLRAELESSAASLLRLLSAASALPFQLAPTEAQLKLQQYQARLAAKRAQSSEA